MGIESIRMYCISKKVVTEGMPFDDIKVVSIYFEVFRY